MKSFTEIIQTIGVHHLAEIFGIDAAHVRVMRGRNSIPPEYWGRLLKAAPSYGIHKISSDDLEALRDKRFNRKARSNPLIVAGVRAAL